MAQGTYPTSYYTTKNGQLHIVISEALILGEKSGYQNVSVKGGAKLFPEKFIQSRVKEFIHPTRGLLFKKSSTIDKGKIVAQAKSAQDEIVKEEYGLQSAKLLEMVLYEQEQKPQLMKGSIEKELTAEEALQKGKKVEAAKDKVIEDEFQDTSKLEGFDF